MNNSEPDAEEFATIAEAARRVGIDPRQVRRYLLRLAPTDKRQDSQRTHKGQPIVLVRVSAVEALRTASVEHETATDSRNGQATDRTGHPTGVSFDAAVEDAPTAGQLVPLFQRLLEEKDARIGDLKSEVEALRAALEREQQNHARTQTLRALEAPTIAQETRPAADDTGSGPEGAQAGAGEAPGATAAASRPAAGRSWWQVWRKKAHENT